MTDLDELRITFFQECEDLLDRLDTDLRALAEDATAAGIDTIHAVFRAVHSIKGGAGAFGLDDLVGFSHLFETVLDNLRAGQMEVTAPVAALLQRAGDVLYDLVQAARSGGDPPADSIAAVVAELELHAGGAGEDTLDDFEFEPLALDFAATDTAATDTAAAPGAAAAGIDAPPATGVTTWEIRLAPRADMYMNGHEPAALITALAGLGTVRVAADWADVPSLDDFSADDPQLRWSIRLTTEATEAEIAAIFDFIEDAAAIRISRAPSDPPASPAATVPPDPGPGAGTAVTPSEGFAPPGAASPMKADALPDTATPTDSGLPPGRAADPPSPDIAPEQLADTAATPPGPAPPTTAAPGIASSPDAPPRDTPPRGNVVAVAPPVTVRVDLERVDRLANLIGELVIMEAVLSRIISDAGLGNNADAVSGLDRIRQLAGEIQESVMAIRAQPLRPIFQRMERVLREATAATGKVARLVTTGAGTEVDKTVIERLVDPLTHMIRNAVDHGLEDAATRQAAGKPEQGTITLSAAHRSGRVLIEIGDDGGGIDRSRLRRIAEDKGLIAPDTVLSEAETDAILFMPGFSSKADVSAVSGRGVGLDVVQREIQALGGRVTIASRPGAGSVFTISLPLTLAVLDGMLVEFAGQTMVLPLTSVAETLNPAGATIHDMGATGRMVVSEGRLIPVIDLAARFGLADGGAPPGVLVVIEGDDGIRAAVAAARILDQRQVVIKSLEDHCGPVPGISAATILGDGRIALILDPEALLRDSSAAPLALAGGFA